VTGSASACTVSLIRARPARSSQCRYTGRLGAPRAAPGCDNARRGGPRPQTGPRTQPTAGGHQGASIGESLALNPCAWCRRALGTLTQRRLPGQDAAYLTLLLTCFIELDPSPDTFIDLLARYTTDPRHGIAEAARIIERSWRREYRGVAAARRPPLQETLRTLGGLLDDAGAQIACVAVEPQQTRVETFGEVRQRNLGAGDLRREIAGRVALRGQVPPADPTAPTRFETLLRAVGAMLDVEPEQAYKLVVTTEQVVVDSGDGATQVYTAPQLTALLRAAIYGRGAPDPAPS
jgi:hypothetical protein